MLTAMSLLSLKPALPTDSEKAYSSHGFCTASQERAMCKQTAMAKGTRALFFAVPLFASMALPTIAQQPAPQQSTVPGPAGAMIGGAAAETIAAEGELKATVRTFQGSNPRTVYRYYWWHDGCYLRYPAGNYQSVSAEYCHQSH
jgi:hypothetical protein